MDERWLTAVRFVASQLVFVAALLHVGIGAMEWLRRIQYGVWVPYQIQYPLFVVTGVAIIAGMALAWQSPRKRPWYLAGFLAMLAYVFAYFGWHLGGHRRFIVFGQRLAPPEPITWQFFVDHYFAGPFETVALTVELLAAVLLAVLYVASRE